MSKKGKPDGFERTLRASAGKLRGRKWMMLAGGVIVVHAMAALFIGLEADSSGEVLMMTMIAAVVLGMFLFASGYGPVAAIAAAAGPPTVWAKWRWYWTIDMHSPAGAAQSLVEWLFAWTPPPPAHWALAGVLSTIGLGAWGFGWFNDFWDRKTGRPFIEFDE